MLLYLPQLQTAGAGASSTGDSPINTAVPSISSAPYNNGTETSTKKPKTKCASSGFLTRTQGTGSIISNPTGTRGLLPIPMSGQPQPTGGYGYGRVRQ